MSVLIVTGTGFGVGKTVVTAALASRAAAKRGHRVAVVGELAGLQLADVVRRVVDLDATHDSVIVDGVGGLLVPFTSSDRWTLVDLAAALRAPALVVTTTGPDAPNHTALTVGRLAEDGIALAGVVIGSWPDDPDLITRCNVAHLAELSPDGRLAGMLPAGIAEATNFSHLARAALAPRFGGTFDHVRFAASHQVQHLS